MLLLARALDRTRELGVRMALGAGRASIVRVLITEAALLTLVGGGLGVLLAYAGIEAFLRYVPTSVPRTDMVTLNGQVLIAAVVLSVAAGMSAGLVPALRLSRRSLWNRLRGGDRAGSRDSRLRSWFVGGQVAIAVLLLSGAGLLVSSFVRIVSVDPGFEPEGAREHASRSQASQRSGRRRTLAGVGRSACGGRQGSWADRRRGHDEPTLPGSVLGAVARPARRSARPA